MTIDPQDPDWAALAPIRELGPGGRVPGGVRCATEAGPLAAIAYWHAGGRCRPASG